MADVALDDVAKRYGDVSVIEHLNLHIDDHELSWGEFGRLLTTHAGWGMRIVFVPDDELHLTPRIGVREPEKG